MVFEKQIVPAVFVLKNLLYLKTFVSQNRCKRKRPNKCVLNNLHIFLEVNEAQC